MLSVRRCRQILGSDCSLTDSQIELVRDQFSVFADVGLELAREESRQVASNDFNESLRDIPEEERDEIIERSAIMEYDGSSERTYADHAALRAWRRAKDNNNGGAVN